MIGWKKTLGAALLSIACAQSWATTLSVTATPGTSAPGSTVSVAVNVADVADLAGYNFSLSYDTSILRYTGYTAGGFLGSGGASTDQGFLGAGNGLIDFAYGTIVSDFSGVTGGGLLASFTFETLADGVSALTLFDTLLVSNNLDVIAADVVSGSLAVETPVTPPVTPPGGEVPEPASLALLGIGALAVGAMRRRRTAVAA